MTKPTVNAAIVTNDAVTIVIDGHTTPIVASHPNYDRIRQIAAEALTDADYQPIVQLLDIPAAVEEFSEGRVTVVDGEVLYDGTITHNAVSERILAMMGEGFTVGPMLRFLENLMENPSFRAVNELYGFLEASDLPITPDGCFLAYKQIRMDWKDHYTGKFDNSIGATPSMNRNEVNEDPNQTCSEGLHVCSQEYLPKYGGGGRTVLCKVNPRDVVSVPRDYNNSKMRTCAYTVISEVEKGTRGGVIKDAVYVGRDITAPKATLVTDVMTMADAMKHFGINSGALRKRLDRGATAKRVFVDGAEMVQIIDPDAKDDTIMSFEDAIMHYYGVNDADTRSALRKRLSRGTSAKWILVSGVDMVKIITN